MRSPRGPRWEVWELEVLMCIGMGAGGAARREGAAPLGAGRAGEGEGVRRRAEPRGARALERPGRRPAGPAGPSQSGNGRRGAGTSQDMRAVLGGRGERGERVAVVTAPRRDTV